MIERVRLYILLAFGVLIGVSVAGFLATADAETPNLIANQSVETISSNASLPTSWKTGVWGSNSTSFQFVKDEGHSGSKSVRVEMTQYSSGDAKWYFNPVQVQPGQDYTYSEYYKSNVTTDYIAQFHSTTGAISYRDLGQSNAASDWTAHSVHFVAPSDVRTVTMFHVIKSVGWLQTDTFDLGLTEVATPTPTSSSTPIPTPSPTITSTPTPTPTATPTAIPTPSPTPSVTPTPSSTPTQSNLVANASVETASPSDPNSPTSWNRNNWGQLNAVFQYIAGGHSGSKSVKITVTNYSSGDAKWYFDPIAASPNSVYRFSDFYMSNVVTRVVVALGMSDGSTKYIELPTAPASASTWRQYQGNVTTPSNTASLTVYHLVSRNGWLQTDDYSLIKFAQASDPVITNHVPNASVEQIAPDGGSPVSWETNRWGNNTASFEYLETGYTGNHSVKTTMSTHTDGDAKWVYESQPILPNTDYEFSDFYQSNVTTSVVAQFEHADGSITYSTLRNASASNEWVKYADSFTTPPTASRLSIFHIIQAVGFLIVDDYAIRDYSPEGFSRGILTLTFDDGWEDNHQNVLPVLGANGLKSTQFYATQFIEGSGQENKIVDFFTAGHEIGSHSVTHADLVTLSQDSLLNELDHSKAYLESLVGAGTITDFALPYGSYNDNVLSQIRARYTANRTVDDGYNSKDNYDRYRLKVKNILSSTTANEVKTWIAKAKHDKTWLILVYHRVGSEPGPYDTTPALFQSHIQEVKNEAIPVLTMKQALAEVSPQL